MKEKIFFAIGCFNILGTIVMPFADTDTTNKVEGTIFYLVMSIIFMYLSRKYILKIITMKRTKAINQSEDEIGANSNIKVIKNDNNSFTIKNDNGEILFQGGVKIGKNDKLKNNNITIEYKILQDLINYLGFDKKNFSIENKNSNYTTLVYKNFDIIRIKYSKDIKWIKLFLTNDDKKKYINDDLFDSQKNKREFYWKSIINDKDDLKKYLDMIKNRIYQIENK